MPPRGGQVERSRKHCESTAWRNPGALIPRDGIAARGREMLQIQSLEQILDARAVFAFAGLARRRCARVWTRRTPVLAVGRLRDFG
jgi:hypothetical protein